MKRRRYVGCPDSLDSARGIFTGALIGVLFWVVIVLAYAIATGQI